MRTNDDGFEERVGTGFRPDATAWAILAFFYVGIKTEITTKACLRLATEQLQDGRIAVSPGHPDAYWPTTLAVIAWLKTAQCADNRRRAIDFLLRAKGKHWPREKDSPVAHDSTLVGWPWIADTHSWVEPTAMALVALKVSGLSRHPRAVEARKLLLDRQLPGGGWNYGNTLVYGRQLDPMPDSTGLALEALSGDVGPDLVASSLAYLERQASRLATPQSLSWAVLGLSAWQRRPPEADALIGNCLDRQDIYGVYATSHLSQLLLALHSKGGLTETLLDTKSSPYGQ